MGESSRQPGDGSDFPDELSFFGAITASISHEINNVLAMVNELSGLLEDSLMMAEKGRPLDPGRLGGITERISGQVGRGKGIVSMLNRFSHCVDNPRASLNLQENLEETLAYCERFARLRRIELVLAPSAGAVRLQGSAFVLQHVLYRCIDLCLDISEEEERITIEFAEQAGGVAVSFRGGHVGEPTDKTSRKQDLLSGLVRGLGGTISELPEQGRSLTVTLQLPSSLSTSPDSSASQQE